MTSDEVKAVIAGAIEQSGNNVLIDDVAVGVLAALAEAGLVIGVPVTGDGDLMVSEQTDVADAIYNGRGWELTAIGLALVRVVTTHG